MRNQNHVFVPGMTIKLPLGETMSKGIARRVDDCVIRTGLPGILSLRYWVFDHLRHRDWGERYAK